MRIENILFKTHCFRLKYLLTTVGLIVIFCCSPLWGSIPVLHQQRPPFLFPNDCNGPIAGDQLIRLNDEYLAKRKRDSSNQHFQQWQDLSPKEQEKMRKKYKEWQSLPLKEQQMIRRRMNQLNRMPPQKRKLYKQLFRQWQHLPPKERKQLQKDLDNWENLSPRQRKSIQRRFKN